MARLRKAVIPAAGFGTRFLPFAKAVPKELIPLVDKPVLQYVVEEAAACGIEEILLVISRGKESLLNVFAPAPELEKQLAAKNRLGEIASIRELAGKIKFSHVYQEQLNGLGGAILCAEKFAAGEPFAILNGDTVMDSGSGVPVLGQLIEVFEKTSSSVMALEKVPRELFDRYGIAAGREVFPGVIEVEQLVEKPDPEDAPGDLAVAARYVYTPELFDCIRHTAPGKGGEIQLPDATRLLMERGSRVFGRVVDGKRYDIGDKLSFLKATVEFGLRRPEFAANFSSWLVEAARRTEEGKNV
ncbi:MAG: UTP--glucose-1-phosphate uridylyltransferase [Lentisphaeria bacterium]|nr:UTP--glucose-1-phosphate uridylyltransferase [Lentisphaeria bacterium]